jgi:hypothetical protein
MNKEDPVAWFSTTPDGKLSNKFACKPTEGNWVEPLYTAPPKREWVGLTDEDRKSFYKNAYAISDDELIERVEAKLKEKNKW